MAKLTIDHDLLLDDQLLVIENEYLRLGVNLAG